MSQAPAEGETDIGSPRAACVRSLSVGLLLPQRPLGQQQPNTQRNRCCGRDGAVDGTGGHLLDADYL